MYLSSQLAASPRQHHSAIREITSRDLGPEAPTPLGSATPADGVSDINRSLQEIGGYDGDRYAESLWYIHSNRRAPVRDYSTVTDLARLRGWSTSVPLGTAT